MDDLVLRYRVVGDIVVVTYHSNQPGTPLPPDGGLYALVEQQGFRKVVLNLKDVPYLMSSRLGQMISLKSRLKPLGGFLCICHLESTLRDVFDVTRLDSLIRIHPTEEDALKSFGS